jgi:uncharacterized protein YndB with AHSA1/START domain
MPETTPVVEPVVRELLVAAAPETCFDTFLDAIASWWPPEHHIGDRNVVDVRIEREVGGRCYDVDDEGGECHWGTVLALDPPRRIVLAWHIQGDWSIDLDPSRQSEVEVTFDPVDGGRTQVRLEHGHLERHGSGRDGVRAGISSPNGWQVILERFGDVLEGRQPRPLER